MSHSNALGRRLWRLLLCIGLVTGFSGLVSVSAAHAQVKTYYYRVNTTQDTHDSTPGDYKCADVNNRCSLRAATEEANADTRGNTYNIIVPAGPYQEDPTLFEDCGGGRTGTICLDNTYINVYGAGPGATVVSGNPCTARYPGNRVFDVYQIGTLQYMTITHGCDTTTDKTSEGGGVYVDNSAYFSHVTVTLNNATLGAGIYINGNGNFPGTTIDQSTFSENLAGQFMDASGAKISSYGYGGGIYDFQGDVNTRYVTFNHNVATGDGGGMYDAGADTRNYQDTFANNAAYDGGAVAGEKYGDNFANSSFSNNSALLGGGAISSGAYGFTIRTSYFNGNMATNGGALEFNEFSGNAVASGGTIAYSKLQSNTAGCTAADPTLSPRHAPAGGPGAPGTFTAPSNPPPPLAASPAPPAPPALQPCNASSALGRVYSGQGGALAVGTPIPAPFRFSLNNNTLNGNAARGPFGDGGGIFNNYVLSGYTNNLTYNVAGDVANTFSSADGGGGLFNNNKANLNSAYVYGNSTNSYGGGIYDNVSANPAALALSHSVVANNQAAVHTGGIYSREYPSLYQTTPTNNSAPPPCINEDFNSGAVCQ